MALMLHRLAAEPGAPLQGVRLMAAAPEKHDFARQMVDDGLAEGTMSLGKGRLTLHLVNGDLVYRIVEVGKTINGFKCELESSPGPISAHDARSLLEREEEAS